MDQPYFTPLKYENEDGRLLRLACDFEFHRNAKEVISVPAGFECDGQSYPRLLWVIDTPQGQGAKAGVVHDYLYYLNGHPHPKTGKHYTRKMADRVYRDALKACGLPAISCFVRYHALRLFGRFAWNAHAKRIQKENLVRPLTRTLQ